MNPETPKFKHFFPRLLRTFNYFDYSLRGESFETQINFNISDSLKTFVTRIIGYLLCNIY
jgi:hypothetical protein